MGKDGTVTRRTGAVVFGALGALLVGGVSQTWLWRWGLAGVSTVTGSQFMWALLIFGVAWAWAEGRVVAGVCAGAVTGLALTSSYYLTQWLADGPHAATSQFAASGPAWTLAAAAGGAMVGLFGAFAGTDSLLRPRLKAIGLTTPAVVVAGGPTLWILSHGASFGEARLVPAAAVFLLAGLSLLWYAVRTCGVTASAQALAASVGIGLVLVLGLLWLETQGWLYLTF